MITLDPEKPIPYICDLKKGVSDAQLIEALKRLEIDPAKDEDLRLWFAIQNCLPAVAMECGNCYKNCHHLPYKELLNRTAHRTILKDYWVPREKWDLLSLAGGHRKLNQTVGDQGFELVKKHWKPKSAQVVLRSCSGIKPYRRSKHISAFYKLTKDYDFDAFVASYCPTPLECDEQYPFAFYQGTMWPDPQEWMPNHIREFLEHFGSYKTAVFWLRPEKEQENREYANIRKYSLPGRRVVLFHQEKTNGMYSLCYYNITLGAFKEQLKSFYKGKHLSLEF